MKNARLTSDTSAAVKTDQMCMRDLISLLIVLELLCCVLLYRDFPVSQVIRLALNSVWFTLSETISPTSIFFLLMMLG